MVTQRHAIGGFAWTYLAFVAGRGTNFVATIALARILAPEDFGLMALALVAVRYLEAMNDMGLGPALVRATGDPRYAGRVAFTLSLAIGGVLAVMLFLLAGPLSRLLGEPRTEGMIQLLAPVLFLGAVTSVHANWMRRNLQFRRRVIPELSRALAKASCSIGFALAGWGVWSLVVGHLVGQVIASAIYARVSGLGVALGFDREVARPLLSFGLQVSFVTMISIVSNSLDTLVVGTRLGATELGYYVLGALVPELVILSISTTTSQVFYPLFSRVQDRPLRLRANYLISLRFTSIAILPAALGLGLVARDFVQVVYSASWLPSAEVMAILSANAAIMALGFNAGDVVKAVGRPGLLSLVAAANILISAPALIFASQYGLAAVAATQLATNALVAGVPFLWTARRLSIPLAAAGRAVRGPLAATVLMALACLGTMALLDDAPAAIRLLATVTVGVAVYTPCIYVLEWKTIRRGLRLRKPR